MLKLFAGIYLLLETCAFADFITVKGGVAFMAEISDEYVVGLLAFAFTVLR